MAKAGQDIGPRGLPGAGGQARHSCGRAGDSIPWLGQGLMAPGGAEVGLGEETLRPVGALRALMVRKIACYRKQRDLKL